MFNDPLLKAMLSPLASVHFSGSVGSVEEDLVVSLVQHGLSCVMGGSEMGELCRERHRKDVCCCSHCFEYSCSDCSPNPYGTLKHSKWFSNTSEY